MKYINLKCKGFQKFVHMKCLKLWLLNSDKNEIDISSCEVCKSQFSMSLIYENFIAPCAQNSCKAWIPCIIAIFLMLSILTLYFQGYLNNNPTWFVLSISIILAIFGFTCCVLSIANIKNSCFERQVTDWNVLSYEIPIK